MSLKTAKCIPPDAKKNKILGWWLFILWDQQMVWVERKLYTATLVWNRRNSDCLTNFFTRPTFCLNRPARYWADSQYCQASKPMMDARLLQTMWCFRSLAWTMIQSVILHRVSFLQQSGSFSRERIWKWSDSSLLPFEKLWFNLVAQPPTGSAFLPYQGLDFQPYMCSLSLYFTEKATNRSLTVVRRLLCSHTQFFKNPLCSSPKSV